MCSSKELDLRIPPVDTVAKAVTQCRHLLLKGGVPSRRVWLMGGKWSTLSVTCRKWWRSAATCRGPGDVQHPKRVPPGGVLLQSC